MGNLLVRWIVMGAATVLLGACAPSKPPKESGFLGDGYAKLQKEDAPHGGPRWVYASPRFTPANYRAVLLEPVAFYPEPQPTAEVSADTLTQIRHYADNSMRQKLGREVMLTDRAGPGVARVQVAITAVGTEDQALRPYQYIPIAFVITGAKAVVEGGRPQDASIAIETKVTDSMTGEVLYEAVRGGTGEEVSHASQGQGGVQPDSLRPLIDTWTDGAAQQIKEFVAQR